MSAAVSPAVADVLARATIDGSVLLLPPGQLDRTTYAATDRVLKALGGKWDRRRNGHVFASDPSTKLAEALGTGKAVSRQQAIQLFETPPQLARCMVERLGVCAEDRCLEPSAGLGRIVTALAERRPARLVAVEIDADNGRAVKAQALASNLIVGDFLDFHPADHALTVVAMNPPFRGNQDVRHVRRAFSMLAPMGRLAAIMSEHAFIGQERECVEWREWLATVDGVVEPLALGTFKESGTNVATRLVLVERSA